MATEWPSEDDWRRLVASLNREYPAASTTQKLEWLQLVKRWLYAAQNRRDTAPEETQR